MPPYKPEEKDQLHEFAEAPPPPHPSPPVPPRSLVPPLVVLPRALLLRVLRFRLLLLYVHQSYPSSLLRPDQSQQIAKICSKDNCKRTTEGGKQCNYHLKISSAAHRKRRIRDKKAKEDAQRAEAQRAAAERAAALNAAFLQHAAAERAAALNAAAQRPAHNTAAVPW
jgi:hypothetical protein